ncbi:hypothetical protein BO86DRAFT_392155 [Aspergillus japonicus CBS 114.51]|uniref:Uncharacterized protein n=2 Tax=Aspergillus TaxID=5052 RepID=A0A2V5GXD3_ASPV1|nr:hypothetical protein BO86DRAFT_392155 [Aspergillus japonicus CBS 114.51]PYI16199.1 hypothetical protein BO99DRAFT_405327 [Aspergillus violaceofuscus CBS 115571]RAH77967.1 hypothetical protein BO86DRAFT_392155 [Aspergillus japonicus CBS 114.51]
MGMIAAAEDLIACSVSTSNRPKRKVRTRSVIRGGVAGAALSINWSSERKVLGLGLGNRVVATGHTF